jgi:glycosyltransferase involved in cell wall biosynthesis
VRILLHCVYYPPEVGGLESHVADLARGLVARGHEVRVVTSRSRPGLARDEEREGVRIRRTWFPRRDPLGWTLHALGSIPATRHWTGWAQVLHAQAFPSIVPVAMANGRWKRPIVATLHTSHFLKRASSPVWKPVLRALIRRPRHVLAASREIAQVAMDLAPDVRVEALANGVETTRFRPVPPALSMAPGTRVLVVPRRLVPKNGVETLVRALPDILEGVPEVVVLLVGDGPERGRLEALGEELGVRSALRFMGSRPHAEMPGFLCSGEVAIFPSLMEATSVAALEAMACGVPVVATNVGGLPEIVDEDVGTLVPPGAPKALAAGVLRLLRRNDLTEMGQRARERVIARWSNARLVERHETIYTRLVETG